MIRIGMSGFSYPEWIGDFYPPKTKREDMLAYYSTRFSAVEINMTFRRQAAEKTIDRWREAVGEDFRFTLKAHQRITHWKRLVDTSEDVGFFCERARALGSRLGPILFQTPPTLTYDESMLDAFCASLTPGFIYAFEPRHDSFAGAAADDVLRRHGVARCCNDDLHDIGSYEVTGPIAYFRFHREEPYNAGELEQRTELIKRISEEGVDVYAFFSHEDDPESVGPALAVQERVT